MWLPQLIWTCEKLHIMFLRLWIALDTVCPEVCGYVSQNISQYVQCPQLIFRFTKPVANTTYRYKVVSGIDWVSMKWIMKAKESVIMTAVCADSGQMTILMEWVRCPLISLPGCIQLWYHCLSLNEPLLGPGVLVRCKTSDVCHCASETLGLMWFIQKVLMKSMWNFDFSVDPSFSSIRSKKLVWMWPWNKQIS